MAMNVSKTQIDRLGERLKKGNITEDDLRLLDTYRRSFADAYDEVVGAVRKELGLEPTGRPAKSTTSIAEKLRRESIRLTQIQDIAGCRLIVADIAEQERVIQSLSRLFENIDIVDRRQKPSHGYRAVHVIVKHIGKMIEIQLRTELQHLWAELSEKSSDVLGLAIKYGGGDKEIQEPLARLSSLLANMEAIEVAIVNSQALLSAGGTLTDSEKQEIAAVQDGLSVVRQKAFQRLGNIVERLESMKGGK